LQSENKLKKTKNIDKITTSKREIEKAKEIEIEIETKETRIEAKTTKKSIEIDARANATTAVAAATTTANRKYLLKLYKQFVCIYISFVFKTVSILLSCLLLFNNL